MRIRVIVGGDNIALRGYIDVPDENPVPAVGRFARSMKPFGMVYASAAEPDYDPFKEKEASND